MLVAVLSFLPLACVSRYVACDCDSTQVNGRKCAIDPAAGFGGQTMVDAFHLGVQLTENPVQVPKVSRFESRLEIIASKVIVAGCGHVKVNIMARA